MIDGEIRKIRIGELLYADRLTNAMRFPHMNVSIPFTVKHLIAYATINTTIFTIESGVNFQMYLHRIDCMKLLRAYYTSGNSSTFVITIPNNDMNICWRKNYLNASGFR